MASRAFGGYRRGPTVRRLKKRGEIVEDGLLRLSIGSRLGGELMLQAKSECSVPSIGPFDLHVLTTPGAAALQFTK
jgi:hypothetical protein